MNFKKVSLMPNRVVSGMRTTGRLHLGHYHGVIKNWVKLQHEYECFFFAADWHALTTLYDNPRQIGEDTLEMVIDWLACGVNPESCKLFIQSQVPENAELHLLLSMITPLGWLERVPTYKDQQAQLKEKDLATYGFLGYPVLQSADILLYKGSQVPVGADQVAHVEISREIARRFNHLYGFEANFQELVKAAIAKLGKKNEIVYRTLMKQYQEQGHDEALERAKALIDAQGHLSLDDRERLYGYVEGTGKWILPEPGALLTASSKMPGLDGRKMSKSYGNTISLREAPEEIKLKIRRMPTDPARVKRTDPGEPTKCPVFSLHEVYLDEDTQQWAATGCRSAGIGCLECKQPLIDALLKELAPIQEKAAQYSANKPLVRTILQEGCRAAREVASETIAEVRAAMGLTHSR